jgi:hypothetical protein
MGLPPTIFTKYSQYRHFIAGAGDVSRRYMKQNGSIVPSPAQPGRTSGLILEKLQETYQPAVA